MSQQITIGVNQSLLDAAINTYGSLEAVMELALVNGLPVSEIPIPGTVIDAAVTDAAIGAANMNVVTALRRGNIVVGTASLPMCPIVTDITVSATATYTATVVVHSGADGMGIEWGIMPAGADEPEVVYYASGEEPTIEVSGLEADTDYTFFARTRCHGNVSGWQHVDITTMPVPSLAWDYVLAPALKAQPDMSAGAPNAVGFYKFDMLDNGTINMYDLEESYTYGNELLYITEERLVITMDTPEMDVPVNSYTQPELHISYKLTFTEGFGYMLVYADSTFYKTFVFTDVEGNSAIYAPLMVFDNTSQAVVMHLIASLKIDELEMTTEYAKLRLTRKHAPIPEFNFQDITMSWLEDALDGEPDPDDPHNLNKTIVTLTPGTYKFGVETQYPLPRPKSAFTLVITVG